MCESEADQLGVLARHEAATIRRLARFQGRHVATVADGLAHLRIRMAANTDVMDKNAKAVIKSIRDLSHAYKVARHATAPLVQQLGGKLDDILLMMLVKQRKDHQIHAEPISNKNAKHSK